MPANDEEVLEGLLEELTEEDAGETPVVNAQTVMAPAPDLTDAHREPRQLIRQEDDVNTDLVDPAAAAAEIIDLKEMVGKHAADYEKTKQNLDVDRGKIDSVVNILLEKVQGGDATTAETESLVKSLEVLARTNDSYVKLLDSMVRLMSSTKGSMQTLIQQNFGGANTKELEAILSQPEDET